MRILPSDEQQSRKEKILQAVVHLYIRTGKPVGSSTIVDNYKVNLSPATIRNVLADLEQEGFLTHPHTSAGRIPTDRGYRFYVDSIVNVQRLAVEEEKKIQAEYAKRRREIDDLMLSTTRVLSALSQCTAFALPPSVDGERLQRVELIPVSPTQVLGVMVSESGFVRHQMISVERMPSSELLQNASRFLNDRMAGLTVVEAQSRLLGELDRFQQQAQAEADFLRSISSNLLWSEPRKDLYLEGTSNVFKFPEFRDYDTMRNFAQLVDEKEALGEVLQRGLSQDGLQVKIGAELVPDLKECSVVSSGYYVHGRPVGIIGILGPKRMEYERMMALVNTVAKLMNRFLEGGPNLMEEKGSHGSDPHA